jgi:uncharacterized membrane protein
MAHRITAIPQPALARSSAALSERRNAINAARAFAGALAVLGAGISTYLALFQYGKITHVWDPFFGAGSALVLHSGILDPLSRFLGFAVHDALLGVAGYVLEAILAFAGLRRVRRTALNIAYGAVVLLMGLTSLVLVVVQAAAFHAGCTLCLASAMISAAIVLLSRHELSDSANRLRGWMRRQRA